MAKAGTKKNRLIDVDKLEKLELSWDGTGPETAEQIYARVAPKERRSSLGQFFTPEPIAQLMTRWISAVQPKTVLDPSVGPGIFARTARRHLPDAKITCVDIDSAPLDLARSTMVSDNLVEFIRGDFLTLDLQEFDAVLANPPYLRHQNLNYEFDIHAEIGRRNRVKVSRLANLYCLFILEICRHLRDGGRASIIVPAEWMNANFGVALKQYFHQHGCLRKLIYFSHDTLAFDDALTTAAILLIEKTQERTETLEVLYVEDKVSIDGIQSLMLGNIPVLPGATKELVEWSTLMGTQKWDRLFAMGAHEHAESLIPLEVICKSRRGIATGANDFFHISPSQALAFGIRSENQKPCVGRAQDIRGLIFSDEDLEMLEREDARTRLVCFGPNLSSDEERYIETGISQGLHERYLLAARSPWYSMENREPAPIWAAVFGRDRLRFIHNQVGISNLTTFHCLYPKSLNERQIAALVALLNSAPIQQRAMRHRRVYGGGLSKFEPKDLLQLEVPDVRMLSDDVLDEIISAFTLWDIKIRQDTEYIPHELNAIAAKLIEAQPASDVRPKLKPTEQVELF